MRITFVLPEANLAGGVRVVAIYADRLRHRGHDVRVISITPRKPSAREVWRSLKRGDGWPRYNPHPASHIDALDIPHNVCAHSGPITDADVPDADIVVATWWETAQWVWSLSPSKGVKVHFMQDYETWCNQQERVDAACALPIPKIIIAKWVDRLLHERFRQSPLALIPNAVDTTRFHAPPRGKQAVPSVGLTYTTMLSKGCDICIAAYKQARRSIPNLRLVAFGSHEPISTLPLPEGPDVTYHQKAPDNQLKHLYASCDAWLFGTRREGFGLPILEAMACRTPVIGTPGGAAPELIAQGGGILVPHEDYMAMADAIERLLALSDDHWRVFSDAALTTATSYSWDDATDRFEEALRRAADVPLTPQAPTAGDHRELPHRAGQAAGPAEDPRRRGAETVSGPRDAPAGRGTPRHRAPADR